MCRRCMKEDNITAHHVSFRSQGVDHHPSNLITLCWNCHRLLHDRKIWLYIDEEGNVFFGGSKAGMLGFT